MQTADFGYLRLRKEKYLAGERKALEERIAKLSGAGDVYVYFKHEDDPKGALWAEDLLKQLKQ